MNAENAETRIVRSESPDGQIERLIDLFVTALNAYCSHPETPDYNYGQIFSALTAVAAMQCVEGGCNSEERLAPTLETFKGNLESSIREIWKAEADIKKGMN